jgi:TolB-like protein/Tfp pilus assembly protein PilF
MEAGSGPGSGDARLESWKEIAAYLNRHVTTVRRWEKHEGLPVHRHRHEKLGSIYAFRHEIDQWWDSRRVRLEPPPELEPPQRELPRRRWLMLAGGVAVGLAAAVTATFSLDRPTRTIPAAIGSIAVLPLENQSGDPTQEFMADAVTEAIIGRLAQVRALRVVSRTSSMVFKGSRQSVSEIAGDLGADAVLQGWLQRSGHRIRIGARLIDARTGSDLWEHEYERDANDVSGLQTELADAIIRETRVAVTAAERARLALVKVVNPAAHLEYVVGRYHLWRDEDTHLQRAIEHFERAARIDPQYAAAYASLAHAWWKRGLWGRRLAETEAPARAAVERALELDANLPEAYVVNADLVRLYDRDLVRAEALATRALALQPGNVDAHYTYALTLMTAGRFPESIGHMETAAELDPLAPAIQSDFGRVLYRARRYDEAIVRFNRALELEPAMQWLVCGRLAEVYVQMGRFDRAAAAVEQAQIGESANQAVVQWLQPIRARILALTGRSDQAKRILDTLERHSPYTGIHTAAAYAAMGDADKAFAVMFDSIERPGPNFAAFEPSLDPLRSDPRWTELIARLARPRRSRISTAAAP